MRRLSGFILILGAGVRWRQFCLNLCGELFGEVLGGGVAPRCRNCPLQRFLADALEMHTGSAATSPGALYRYEHIGIILGIVMLLFRRELDHPPSFGGIAERGEDLSAHAKIGMVHVSLLFCFRKSKGEAAKIIGSHACVHQRRCVYANTTADQPSRFTATQVT